MWCGDVTVANAWAGGGPDLNDPNGHGGWPRAAQMAMHKTRGAFRPPANGICPHDPGVPPPHTPPPHRRAPAAGGYTEEKRKEAARSLARYMLESVLGLGPTFIKLGESRAGCFARGACGKLGCAASCVRLGN